MELNEDSLFILVIILGHFIFNVIATSATNSTSWLTFNEKIKWLLILWLLPFVGAWLISLKIDVGWRVVKGD